MKMNRKGVIGFMITLALGVAVGAATLVVSNEVVKGIQTPKGTPKPTPAPVSKNSKNSPQLPAAAQQAVKTQADYYKSVNQQTATPQQAQNLRAAQITYAQEVQKSQVAPQTAAPAPTFAAAANPYSDDGTVTISGSAVQAPTNDVPAAPITAPVTSTTNALPAAAASTNTSGSTPASSGASTPAGSGFEYYKVKTGDTLFDICQRYYGDGGMWAHILSYQIPSIAGCPNLIFPGQLIALPRRVTSGGTDRFGTDGAPDTGNNGNDGAVTSGSGLPTAPQGDESWQERFQKDYLISDYTLTNSNSMTVPQIQAFLEKKGSCLAQPYRGSTPAQMIFDAAKKTGINPQVILARLQCEQGLISKKSASQKELDWALGVGAYDSGNWNTKFKGFDKQIEGAAVTYKRHYQDAKARLDRGEKVTMQIDGQTVTVKSAATYAFYKYCPHFHGNKLFYDVWRGYRSAF
jgi:hypothetical protein